MNTDALNRTPARPRTSFWQAVGIVAAREIRVKVTSKAFVVTTGLLLAGVLAAVLLLPRLGDLFGDDEPSRVAVTAQSREAVEALDGYTPVVLDSVAAARDAVRAEDVDSAVVPDEASPAGVAVVGLTDAPTGLAEALSTAPSLEVLDPDAPDPALRYFISFGFGVVFFMVAITYGQQIAVSVIEEKQSRIVEILMTAVPARAIMAGKVVGNSAMALGQVAMVAGAVLLGMQVNGDVLPLDGLGLPLVWFVGLFGVGFVMIAALYAAAASLVSRQEDVGQASMPVVLMVMIPYFAVIAFNDDPDALRIMSFVPFCAPVAVPLRVFLGQGQAWEHVLSAALLVVATAAAVWFAAHVYERSILRTGKALRWREAVRGG